VSPPLVTAVVVNWNGADVLPECLESLFAQTWPRLEVILVDNGSQDGSARAAAARWGPRLAVIENAGNEGFARGNNQALQVARGEWVFLLNNDAVADPGAVEALMAAARQRPEAGMLACRVVNYDQPHYFDSVGLLFYPDGVCRSRGWEEKDLGQYDRAEAVLGPNGCAAAYRRDMLDEVGHFDESYFAYLEDLDLGLRAQLRGWGCWYVPEARVRHRKSFTAGTHSRLKAYLVERNRIWTAVKVLPPFLLLVSPLFTANRYLLQAYAAITRQVRAPVHVPRGGGRAAQGLPGRHPRPAPRPPRAAAPAGGHAPGHARVLRPDLALQARRHRAGPEVARLSARRRASSARWPRCSGPPRPPA
jgi:GT2 family glycosyltransferase